MNNVSTTTNATISPLLLPNEKQRNKMTTTGLEFICDVQTTECDTILSHVSNTMKFRSIFLDLKRNVRRSINWKSRLFLKYSCIWAVTTATTVHTHYPIFICTHWYHQPQIFAEFFSSLNLILSLEFYTWCIYASRMCRCELSLTS